MTTIKKEPVDVVIVGFGWTGAIMGMEMTDAGLSVVALERGEKRDTYPDFACPRIAEMCIRDRSCVIWALAWVMH